MMPLWFAISCAMLARRSTICIFSAFRCCGVSPPCQSGVPEGAWVAHDGSGQFSVSLLQLVNLLGQTSTGRGRGRVLSCSSGLLVGVSVAVCSALLAVRGPVALLCALRIRQVKRKLTAVAAPGSENVGASSSESAAPASANVRGVIIMVSSESMFYSFASSGSGRCTVYLKS